MMIPRLLLATLALFVFSGALFAASRCSADAYETACISCPFDSNGKMDRQCYDAKISEGRNCAIISDPVAAAKYGEGKCKGIDRCVSQLETCKASAATGNDQLDCQGATVARCFARADECIDIATGECHDIKGSDIAAFCPSPMLILLLAFGFVSFSGKKNQEPL